MREGHLVNGSRDAVYGKSKVPIVQISKGLLDAGVRGIKCEEMRGQDPGSYGVDIPLDMLKVMQGEFFFPTQELYDALDAKRGRPLKADIIGIRVPRGLLLAVAMKCSGGLYRCGSSLKGMYQSSIRCIDFCARRDLGVCRERQSVAVILGQC